ncbi:MAG: cysteine hydrolase [Salinivirgaceae bacterium]|nr:cysteine hydrolase [Salinivirgaceae bacterium]
MKTALLLIDIQNDYFEDGRYPLVSADYACEKAKSLLDFFRKGEYPLVFVKHITKREKPNLFEEGTKGVEIHENVKPRENEKVFIKHFPNSFRETDLHNHLQSLGIEQLVICGMMTHLCIDASVRAAKDLGYKVLLIADACATRDLDLYENTIEASYIQLSFMAALGSYYAKILTVEDFNNNVLQYF